MATFAWPCLFRRRGEERILEWRTMLDSVYLAAMEMILGSGVARLPERFRGAHGDYLLGLQQGDGGFPGPAGGASDLYYTRFALQGLQVLETAGADGVWPRATNYLRALPPLVGLVDGLSFLHAAAIVKSCGTGAEMDALVAARTGEIHGLLSGCRTDDGGFAAAPAQAARSGEGGTYHTFLAALCYNLLGEPMPEEGRAVELVLGRRTADGGFAESGGGRVGQTNPTAAAVGLLTLAGALDEGVVEGVARFMASMQSADGGLRAHAGAATSDLLSTFTGLYTVAMLDAVRSVRLGDLGRFVRSLASAGGGFCGARAVTQTDVEYTFYGLAALGLLALAAS
jgi:geranylgeranyl transferase type-2 subunit beta